MIYIIVILFVLIAVGTAVYKVKSSDGQSSATSNKQSKTISFTASTSSGTDKPKDQEFDDYTEKYTKWYSKENTVGLCFESERIDPLPNNETETVFYKSDRYAELFGRGKGCSYYPGVGEVHNRTFEVWYQNVNSKEKMEVRIYRDIAPLRTPPVYIENIINGINTNDELERARGYMKLFKGSDHENRRNWYAGLVESEFTGIITKPEK